MLLCILLLQYSSFPLSGQILKKEAWTAVHNDAIKSHKLLILDFSTDWCIPCKELKREVLDKDTVKNFLSTDYKLITINAERDFGVILAKKYCITAYPTILIFNTRGILIGYKKGIEGIETPAGFLKFLAYYGAGKHVLPAKKMNSELNIIYPQFYNDYFAHHHLPDTITVDNYLKTQSNWFSEKNWAVLNVFGQRKKYLNYIIAHADKFIRLYGCMVIPVIQTAISDKVGKDIKKKDSSAFYHDLNILLTLRNSDPTLYANNPSWQLFMELSFWGEAALNWPKFISIWKEYQNRFDNSLDRRAVELIAANCENDSVIQYAQQLQNLKIKNDPTNWRNYALLAGLYLKTNIEVADQYYTKAVQLVNNNPSLINNIVGIRIQNSLQYDDSVFQDALLFMKIYSPTLYSENINFFRAAYFEKHKEWEKFSGAVNNYIQQIGGPDSIKNTKLFFNYAEIINSNNVTNQYCVRSAYTWLDYILKKDPGNAIFKRTYLSLRNKLK